jgi:hypothetical protein
MDTTHIADQATNVVVQNGATVTDLLLQIVQVGGFPLIIILLGIVIYLILSGKIFKIGKMSIGIDKNNGGLTNDDLYSQFYKNAFRNFIRKEVYLDFEYTMKNMCLDIFLKNYGINSEEDGEITSIPVSNYKRTKSKPPVKTFLNWIELVTIKYLKNDFTCQMAENHFPTDLNSKETKDYVLQVVQRITSSLVANMEMTCDPLIKGIETDFYQKMGDMILAEPKELEICILNSIKRVRARREDLVIDALDGKTESRKNTPENRERFLRSMMFLDGSSVMIR